MGRSFSEVQEAMVTNTMENTMLETDLDELTKAYYLRPRRKDAKFHFVQKGQSIEGGKFEYMPLDLWEAGLRGNVLAIFRMIFIGMYCVITAGQKQAPETGYYRKVEGRNYLYMGSKEQAVKLHKLMAKSYGNGVYEVLENDHRQSLQRKINRLSEQGFEIDMVIPGNFWTSAKVIMKKSPVPSITSDKEP